MRRFRSLSMPVLAAVLVFGLAAPASSDGISFSIGAGFVVGGASFHVAYASSPSAHAPYYYRTAVPLRYGGYACSEHCIAAGGYWYHVPGCPLVGHHFVRFGHAGPYSDAYGYSPPPPYPVYWRPRYGYGKGYGHGYYSGGYSFYGYGHHGYYKGHGGYKHFKPRYGYGHKHGYGGYKYGRGYKHGHGGYKYGYGGYKSGYGHGRGHAPGAARRTRPPRN